MVHTLNEIIMHCPPDRAFSLACQVDRWPEHLPHYRRVRFIRQGTEPHGLVEMAAVRQFGAFAWPVWWVSEMEVSHDERMIRYRHVRGITRGMQVAWKLETAEDGTKVTIVHEWERPTVGKPAAARLIGPVFVHFIADRTLEGLKAVAERRMEAAEHA
jgi:ribosome-associated toxin RatA of RatAB toxin-antitoxin module